MGDEEKERERREAELHGLHSHYVWATHSKAVYKPLGYRVVGMSSVLQHTSTHNPHPLFTLDQHQSSSTPNYLGFDTVHQAHVHIPPVAPRYTHHIYDVCFFPLSLSSFHRPRFSWSIIPFTVKYIYLCMSFFINRMERKTVTAVLTPEALQQTSWLINMDKMLCTSLHDHLFHCLRPFRKTSLKSVKNFLLTNK